MKKSFRSVPRPAKTLFYFIGILLAAFLLYIFIGAPPLSDVHRYRRAERANLVGPAEILGTIDLKPAYHNDYNRLLIADDGDGVIMYMYNTEYDREKFVYRKKQGEITVFAAPSDYGHSPLFSDDVIELPILLFDDFPQAVRAEISFTLWTERSNGDTVPKNYFQAVHREQSGYFCFAIDSTDFTWSTDGDGPTLSTLSEFTSGESSFNISDFATIPVTAKLYDADNGLIHEEMVTIRSVIGDAHYQRGDLPE